MGFLRRLFGGADDTEPPRQLRPRPETSRSRSGAPGQTSDDQAIERYRYLLRTAPPETLEEAHAEAFAQLTPEQRRQVLGELSQELPERVRLAAEQAGDDPQALARTATRAELRQPGTMERTFGGTNRGGIGLGGVLAGGFFGSFAGMIAGSMVAQAFFDDNGDGSSDGSSDGGDDGGDSGDSSDSGDTGDAGDSGATGFDGGDASSGDMGGDFGGDLGGDFGDFGDIGGDFGGGDF